MDDSNKVNKEDDSVPKNGNSAIRDSLVISERSKDKIKKSKKRKRENSCTSSTDDDDRSKKKEKKLKKKKKDKKHKDKKRKKNKKYKSNKYDNSSNDDDDDISSDSSDRKKRHKKKEKKRRKLKEKHDKLLNIIKKVENKNKMLNDNDIISSTSSFGPAVPDDIINKSKAMAPMSKEEWEKRQNTIKRVYDSESGRHRLIRGDGEIIEECVSRERHKEINKQATMADGLFFQMNINKK